MYDTRPAFNFNPSLSRNPSSLPLLRVLLFFALAILEHGRVPAALGPPSSSSFPRLLYGLPLTSLVQIPPLPLALSQVFQPLHGCHLILFSLSLFPPVDSLDSWDPQTLTTLWILIQIPLMMTLSLYLLMPPCLPQIPQLLLQCLTLMT